MSTEDLFFYTASGDLAGVEATLRAGVSVNACDSFGWSVLMCAAVNGRDDIVRCLVTNGADVRQALEYLDRQGVSSQYYNEAASLIRSQAANGKLFCRVIRMEAA
jgi:ankyrin repeat protein